MILGSKSISILLYADEHPFNEKTLEVWLKLIKGYKDGGELILISFKGDYQQAVDIFMDRHEEDGVRIVGFVADESFSWSYILQTVSEWASGNYSWISNSNTYPNGDILGRVKPRLSDGTLLILNRIHIKEQFDYSNMRGVMRSKEELLKAPNLDLESFLIETSNVGVMSVVFKNKKASALTLANSWNALSGVEWVYLDKASVFVVEN